MILLNVEGDTEHFVLQTDFSFICRFSKSGPFCCLNICHSNRITNLKEWGSEGDVCLCVYGGVCGGG